MSAEIVNLTPVSEANTKTTWGHELYKVVIPSVVTAVCGFFIWSAQAKLQQTVTTNSQMLQTQMALKEEFYRRRLTRYEEACSNVAGVKYALDVAWATPENETKAMSKLAEFDEFKRSNVLYWSDGIDRRLGALWSLGVKKLRYRQFEDKATNESIRSEISALHRQMKDDLAVEVLSKVLQQEKHSE